MKNAKDKLSDPEVRHAQPKEKPYKLPDGAGLYCMVLASGVRSWRFNYRFNGKHKTLTIGTYPETGLSAARALRDEARVKISNGIDPALEKQLKKNISTEGSFKAIAESWYGHSVTGWSDTHAVRVRRCLEKDIYPVIGNREIVEIEAPEMIVIIRNVVDRGALDVVKRVKQYMQQVFDYAVAYGGARRTGFPDDFIVKVHSEGALWLISILGY